MAILRYLSLIKVKVCFLQSASIRRPVIDRGNILNHVRVSLDFWHKVWARILKCKIISLAILFYIFLMLKVEGVLVGPLTCCEHSMNSLR